MLPQSKIFNEYAKLAMDKGIVKQAETQPVKEAADDTAQAVALLYGVKPNGKEDDKHIMEKAHPDPVAVARSYDAMNAIVEDNILRQEIMTWIAEKVPNGQLGMKRYVAAHNALLKSLVNIGFTTDNANQEQLRKLADACSAELTKEAIAWGAAARWGIPALLGLIALIQHTPDVAVTVSSNAQGVLDEIAGMKGEMYLDDIEQDVQLLKNSADAWQNTAYTGGQLRAALQRDPTYEKQIHDYAASMIGKPMGSLPPSIRITAEYLMRIGNTIQEMPQWKARVKMFTPKGSEWGPEVDKIRLSLIPFIPQEQTKLENALSGLDKAVKTEKKKIAAEIATSTLFKPRQQQQQQPGPQEQSPLALPAYSPALAAQHILEIGKDG